MKQIHFILFYFILLFIISCKKKKEIVNTKIVKGYIYNSNDSTPFKNTKFKLYEWSYSISNVLKEEQEFFYTDSNGYFDYSTTKMSQIMLAWPSYHTGAAYIGPPEFGTPKNSIIDNENRVNTHYFDTIYTAPWY